MLTIWGREPVLKKRLKVLLFSGIGAVGLCLVTWGSMSVVAKKQTAEMDAIAQEFFQNYPATEQNDSAKTLDKLSASLGLNLLSNSISENLPVSGGTADFQPIKETVGDYFNAQKIKEQGPLDPIPATVKTYLNNNQATLAQIQTHLQSQEAPVWHFDADLYADFEYALPAYIGLVDLRKLLLLKAVTHAQQNQSEQMVGALEAAQALIDVPAQRPDLISYLVSLIAMDDTIAIMRHLEGVPLGVSEQLLAMDQQQLGVDRLRFDNWTFYRSLSRAFNDPTRTEDLFSPVDFGLAVLPGGVLEKPYLALSNTNTTRLREKSYDQMLGENICSLDIEVLEAALLKEVPWWNVIGKVALPSFMAQWRKGGDRMLGAELTHHIVQAKSLAAEQGQWPETLPNLASQACPGESWTYAVTPEGEMTLSFSQDLSKQRPGDPDNRLPLTYQASLAQ